jgi:carboxyl-terminal processing protease
MIKRYIYLNKNSKSDLKTNKSMAIKHKNIYLVFLLGAITMVCNPYVNAQDVQSSAMKYGRLLRLIESYYVDTTNIDALTETAIVEVLRNLDPHSVYISKEEVKKMEEPLQGNFEGVGISFNVLHDTLLVVTTIPGGPSEKVGLRAGDRILTVDKKNIAGVGLKNAQVYDYLRGKKGTRVDLQIKRKGEPGLLDFTVIRDKIPINSLDASYMLNESTGYIKLNKFSATTTQEFNEAIIGLKAKAKLNGIVLDLRGNGGGYLMQAVELADHFLNASKLIVYTEGTKSEKKEFTSTNTGEFEDGKLIVLIDEYSASASEIVAGAIQDWDRGVIIGRRSFGKGLVQNGYPLTDGSMIRLTTAHYYTPNGRCIQKPYTEGVDEYQKDYFNRVKSGELFSKDSVVLNKEEKYNTKIHNRIVYGGGGIMPDLFIPLDTSKYYAYYNNLIRKNLINTGVLDMMDLKRDELKQNYPDFKTFNANIKRDDKSVEFAKPLMLKQIKALIARDLFSMSELFQILNQDDEAINKALETLSKKGSYEKILTGK